LRRPLLLLLWRPLLLELAGLSRLRLSRLSESGLAGLRLRTLLRRLLPLSGLHNRAVGCNACHR
jgi:hypothetical protein